MYKLITQNQEIELTKEGVDILMENYENGEKIFEIKGSIFFRGAITNAEIVSGETKQEKRQENSGFMKMLKDYENATSDVKRDIKSMKPAFAQWLKARKSIKSMPQPRYNEQVQARKDSGEKRALKFN